MTFTIPNMPPEVYERIQQLADETHLPIEDAVVNALVAGTNDLLRGSDERALHAAWDKLSRENSEPVRGRDMSDLPHVPPSQGIDLDAQEQEADWGPPHLLPNIEFVDPPGIPVTPVFMGELPFELCCDIDDPSQRVPE